MNNDEELEQDVLKLQIHSIPLNLNWDEDQEEFDDESDGGNLSLLQSVWQSSVNCCQGISTI